MLENLYPLKIWAKLVRVLVVGFVSELVSVGLAPFGPAGSALESFGGPFHLGKLVLCSLELALPITPGWGRPICCCSWKFLRHLSHFENSESGFVALFRNFSDWSIETGNRMWQPVWTNQRGSTAAVSRISSYFKGGSVEKVAIFKVKVSIFKVKVSIFKVARCYFQGTLNDSLDSRTGQNKTRLRDPAICRNTEHGDILKRSLNILWRCIGDGNAY